MLHRPLRAALVVLASAAVVAAAWVVPASAAVERASYIVQVQAGSERAVEARAKALGGEIGYRYDTAIRGFSVTLPVPAADALAKAPGVLIVEADGLVSIDDTQSPATWGIDRIDQLALPLSNSYTYSATASNVNAYIIDTGIRATHSQFGGRVLGGINYVNSTSGDSKWNDCNGHGTHVAGTVGGSTYGVAKSVKLYAVRVLNCRGSGTSSSVIAGINWVARQKTINPSTPMVANMSLGGGVSFSIDSAVANAISAGVVFAIAAGNSNANACNYSPARVGTAITVGATTSSDARASYSNYGSCLDIFAPGSSITSAWNSSDTAINTISGTSMATPHVAGVAALYLSANPTQNPGQVAAALSNRATAGVVSSVSGSPNLLLSNIGW